jgi:hypothetical protein
MKPEKMQVLVVFDGKCRDKRKGQCLCARLHKAESVPPPLAVQHSHGGWQGLKKGRNIASSAGNVGPKSLVENFRY